MAAGPYVLIIGAVDGELSGLRSRMVDGVAEDIGRRRVVRGAIHGIPVRLMATGPGMANTVQALTAALERVPPCLILQTGCAGAFRESGLGIGDVGVASEEIDAHLGLEPPCSGDPPAVLPFSVMNVNGVAVKNRYPLSRRWARAALTALGRASAVLSSTTQGAAAVKVVRGPFLTVSTITATDLGARRHYRHHRACMEAMEGAGAAHAACHYGIPLLEVRAASNIVGRRNRGAWDLDLAFRRSAWAVLAILNHYKRFFLENIR